MDAADVQRMIRDLGVDRRDQISAPEEDRSRRNLRSGQFAPNGQENARDEADQRRARLQQARDDDPRSVVVSRWNDQSNFGADDVFQGLENRYSGQGHRAALTEQMKRNKLSNAGFHDDSGPRGRQGGFSRYSGQELGDERRLWLAEHDNNNERHNNYTFAPPGDPLARQSHQSGRRVTSYRSYDTTGQPRQRAGSPRAQGTKRFAPGHARHDQSRSSTPVSTTPLPENIGLRDALAKMKAQKPSLALQSLSGATASASAASKSSIGHSSLASSSFQTQTTHAQPKTSTVHVKSTSNNTAVGDFAARSLSARLTPAPAPSRISGTTQAAGPNSQAIPMPASVPRPPATAHDSVNVPTTSGILVGSSQPARSMHTSNTSISSTRPAPPAAASAGPQSTRADAVASTTSNRGEQRTVTSSSTPTEQSARSGTAPAQNTTTTASSFVSADPSGNTLTTVFQNENGKVLGTHTYTVNAPVIANITIRSKHSEFNPMKLASLMVDMAKQMRDASQGLASFHLSDDGLWEERF